MIVAANWKTAEKETKDYCSTVAHLIKERHAELSEAKTAVRLTTIDSISLGPKKETKQRSADKIHKRNACDSTELGVLCCLPTMDYISSRQANETTQRGLQTDVLVKSSVAFGYQQANQFPGMYVPTNIDPVDQEQSTMNSHDYNISTYLMMMRMYHQRFLHNQVIPESSPSATWGDGNINTSNTEMSHLIPSVLTRQRTQWTQMPMMKGGHGDNKIEFPILRNVSQRAVISNMMLSATHEPQQPIKHREGICSFEGQRRSSAPKVLQTSEQVQKSTYQVQELDVHDSDVVGMWLTCDAEEEI
jgi:hypothetical protein